MATTLTTASGKTKLTMKFGADTAVITPMLDNICKLLYAQIAVEEGERPVYATLTTAQKLALIDAYVRDKLMRLHKYQVKQAAIAVSDAADTATLD